MTCSCRCTCTYWYINCKQPHSHRPALPYATPRTPLGTALAPSSGTDTHAIDPVEAERVVGGLERVDAFDERPASSAHRADTAALRAASRLSAERNKHTASHSHRTHTLARQPRHRSHPNSSHTPNPLGIAGGACSDGYGVNQRTSNHRYIVLYTSYDQTQHKILRQ